MVVDSVLKTLSGGWWQRTSQRLLTLWRQSISLWRHSLHFRTVLVTLALSGLAISFIGLYLVLSVSSNLFQSQLDRVLGSSNNAQAAAQRILDSSDASNRAGIQSVMRSVLETVQSVSGSSIIGYIRAPGQSSQMIAPAGSVAPALDDVLTDDLRLRVQQNPGRQFWQSVSLDDSAGRTQPAVVVGSDVHVPGAGRYELYMAYGFADAQQTLSFMQLVGLIGAIALLVLLSVITVLLLRWVIEPIRVVANTSERLAAGELEVRIPVRGEDELARLAASFNGMADSLQSQIRELATLSKMQQRFVSDVSHELRTPLTTIRLAGDILYDQRAELPAAQARSAELLHTQTERFERLLADLLEISRYDAGSVELEVEQTNLVMLITDVSDSMAELAQERASQVEIIASDENVYAAVDPRRIRRILRNLLGNAIEHGDGKPVIIRVKSDEISVALSVQDHGIGMSKEAQQHVFDRFWRADPSRVRTIGGTGLGLAISLEDATAHGGTLEVWSAVGEGSVFRLTLPRVRGAAFITSPLPLGPAEAEKSEVTQKPVTTAGNEVDSEND